MTGEQVVNSAPASPHRHYAFGPFLLDSHAKMLLRDGKAVPLAPKTADLLVLLVRNHGQLVTKETLIESLWPGVFVEEANLAQHVSRLRRVLEDGAEPATYIDTIPRRGYRFVAKVVEHATRRGRDHPTRSPRPTVGRAREIAALSAAFHDVQAGDGLMVCIGGEPGKGKTTLVETFLSKLQADGAACTIARGRCTERLTGAEAYLPFVEALESLVHVDPSGAAGRLMTAFTSNVAAASPQQLKRELSTLLRELAVVEPVVLFIDDVHWAGASTIEMLGYLATRLGGTYLLIVTTCRLEELRQTKHPFLALKQELQSRRLCRELELDFLTEADIREYLAREFPGNDLPLDFPRMMHATTDGSPLFMVDLARSLRLRGAITQEDGCWRLARPIRTLARELPESVRAMIERKIGQLDEADRRLLAACSVQGDAFDSAVIADALSLDRLTVEERLAALDREFALVQPGDERELADLRLTLRYRFVHALYQNVLYDSLTPALRSSLSGKVAEAILRLHGDRSADSAFALAPLFEAARDLPRAVEAYAVAAERAQHVFAYHEAEQLARRGLALLGSLNDATASSTHELPLLSSLSVALMATKGFATPEVEAVCRRVRALSAGRPDVRYVVPALYGLVSLHEVRAEYESAVGFAQELLDLAERQNDTALRVHGHGCFGDALLWKGDYRGALHHTDCAIALAGTQTGMALSLSGFDAGISSRVIRALALFFLGDRDHAMAASDEAIGLARAKGEPPTMMFAHFFRAVLYQLCGQRAECLAHADTAIQLCAEHGLPDWAAWAGFWRGWAVADSGDAAQSIASMQQSLAEQDALGSRMCRSMMLGMLAEVYAQAGRADEGRMAVDAALTFVAASGERFYEAELDRLKGQLFIGLG